MQFIIGGIVIMLGRLNSAIGNSAENAKESTWTFFRILASAMFMTHGIDKLLGENPQPFMGGGMTSINVGELVSFPIPLEINALFIAGSIELVGGFLILIGLWTHVIAFLACASMLMAYLIVHLAWFPTLNRGEIVTLYFLTYLVLFTFGPGPYSVDTWLSVRRQEKRKKKMEKKGR